MEQWLFNDGQQIVLCWAACSDWFGIEYLRVLNLIWYVIPGTNSIEYGVTTMVVVVVVVVVVAPDA